MLYQLSYFRNFLWAKMDSNHRRRKPADLQSAPFGHSGICPSFSWKLKIKSWKLNNQPPKHQYQLFSTSLQFSSQIIKVTQNFQFSTINYQLFSSLLSDSNQRPRDYKSRALANWAKEAITQKMQPSRSNASETAANLVIYFFPAKYLGFFYLLRCFSLYLTSCLPSASTSKSIASSNVSHTLLA